MAMYNGRKWTREALLEWVGSVEQVAGARRSVLAGGKADGVEAVDVSTGAGLRYTVLPGRGMDLAQATWRDTPLAFFSGTGITSPGYYEEPGLGWLRSFYGGLLTTCGITAAGAPSVDEGKAYGLHGRLSNAAAEDVGIEQKWVADEYTIRVRGVMRESAAMFENLRLTRTVESRLGGSTITLRDEVENVGYEPQPVMLLYHFNFGWPLLSEGARIVGSFSSSSPRDEVSRRDRGLEEAFRYGAPIAGYEEKVFYHTTRAGGDGRATVGILNDDCAGRPLGVLLHYRPSELPAFTQWKMPRRGFYVLGLEPGTINPDGRAATRAAGKLPLLAGMGRREITIEVEVVEGREAVAEAERRIGAIR